MNIQKVAIIGAGTMGCSTALELACFNYKVYLKDLSDEKFDIAKERIGNEFRMLKMVRRDLQSVEINDILNNIEFTKEYNFTEIDLVIENITEDWNLKEKLYQEFVDQFNDDTIFAANTSCIPITKIASLLSRPENVLGLHLMNPVSLNPLVEVIKGYHTNDKTLEIVLQFLKNMNKKPVVVEDSPGFVANRLSHLFMNEAAFLVQENIAKPHQIDKIFKLGYGHKMGPLETVDLIGVDTVVNSLEILYQNFQDSKFRCCPLLKKMVQAGLLGKKSGEGFYKY
jgi:3-hydroxybutyryl-CoA dehydrogenase